MRRSFDNYYKKLNALYKKEYGTRPTVTFDSKLKSVDFPTFGSPTIPIDKAIFFP